EGSAAMSAHHTPGMVPTRVGVRAALDVAELDLIRRPRRMDGDGKRHVEKFVRFVPVDLGFESEHPRAGIQDHPLLELRRAELADEPDRRAQGTLGLALR